ncbi:hypothetical protein [Aquimarina sp. 2201CG14-23]|uniref:hypothetical protein n=1 Tax=Aquimarina mycalae TaxID=3040073 RepID=UPI00247804FC|nr:hypothetical protein [Aquimarina sp. 2201CG14-23]MDH7447572.1 hypothetical protein [Aquimarina sp. 2201CG14-23]
MEKIIKIKNEYNSLDALQNFLKTASDLESSKEYDTWEHRTDENGQIEQCLILKKSSMHGMKVCFQNENTIKMNYIIPNKMMHAYFGKSQKRYQNILEIVTGKIKDVILAPAQNKAFKEMENVFSKITT